MTVDPSSTEAPVPDPIPVATDTGAADAGTIADLADTLVNVATPSSGPDTRPTDGAILRYGKVTAIGSGANLNRIQVDATASAWLTYDAGYAPAVNDLVYLLTQGPIAHVGGKLGGSQPTPPPVGVIHPYAGATAPTGWLLCNGAAVSRTTYSILFGVCGTTFGSGDGSTTFNIPNLTDRAPVGIGTLYVRGEVGGAETRTLTTSNLPAHTHGSGGSHSHTGVSHDHAGSSMPQHDHTGQSHTHGMSHDHAISPSSHDHSMANAAGTVSVQGGGATSVASGAAGSTGNTTINAVAMSGNTAGGTGGVNAASAGTPNIAPTSAGVNATDPGPTASTGSGTALNIMSPYLGMQFILRALP